MAELMEYLKRVVVDCASDLFIVAGGPVCEKLDKRMVPISAERVFPRETEQLIMSVYELAGRSPDHYLAQGDDDFSFSVPGLARFRVNAYRQRGSLAAVVRVVLFDIPTCESLSIPKEEAALSKLTAAGVSVCG